MSNTHIRIGSCILVKDDSTSEVRFDNGKSMSLTHPESAILKCLYQNQGQVVTKHDLVVAGWGRPDIIGPNSLPVAMANIRKVLSLAEIEIVNVPRVGYKLELPLQTTPSIEQPSSPPRDIAVIPKIATMILSIVIILTITAVNLFVYLSWVKIDCRLVAGAYFCFNERETFDTLAPLTPNPKAGETYYNSSGQWIKVKDND